MIRNGGICRCSDICCSQKQTGNWTPSKVWGTNTTSHFGCYVRQKTELQRSGNVNVWALGFSRWHHQLWFVTDNFCFTVHIPPWRLPQQTSTLQSLPERMPPSWWSQRGPCSPLKWKSGLLSQENSVRQAQEMHLVDLESRDDWFLLSDLPWSIKAGFQIEGKPQGINFSGVLPSFDSTLDHSSPILGRVLWKH